MQTNVRNRLNAIRSGRGVAAAELAREVGVSRQTIYAIEAGTYVPNTEVSLKLARALEVGIEELFSLAPEDEDNDPQPLGSEILSADPLQAGQAVQVCRIGKHLVSVPVHAFPYLLPEANGVVARGAQRHGRGRVNVFSEENLDAKRILLAGCDPAIGLLARMAERSAGVEIVPAAASSRLALQWLKAGKVHIAGMHLQDAKTGEFNVPIVRRECPDEDFTIVTFAQWQEGLVTASGNPKGIRKVEDLARRTIRFVNREAGSGSRALLDVRLGEAGMQAGQVAGYDRVVPGHLAATYAVHAGDADCCIATESAARTFGLGFVPMQSERYDFVLRRRSLELPAVQHLLDVLQKAGLRRKLQVLAGYDTAQTGAVVV